MKVTKRKLIQIVAIERMVVISMNVKYIPDNERINAIISRVINTVIWRESLKTSFFREIESISFCIFCEVKNPKIIPMLIISTKRTTRGVRRNIYLIAISNISFKTMNESIVRIPIESKENIDSFINSFFFPLKNHDAKTMNIKMNKNKPAMESN